MDWQKGDLALCVKRGKWIDNQSGTPSRNGPKCGELHKVTELHHGYLCFAPWSDNYFNHTRFIRVTPPKNMTIETTNQSVEA